MVEKQQQLDSGQAQHRQQMKCLDPKDNSSDIVGSQATVHDVNELSYSEEVEICESSDGEMIKLNIVYRQ